MARDGFEELTVSPASRQDPGQGMSLRPGANEGWLVDVLAGGVFVRGKHLGTAEEASALGTRLLLMLLRR